MDLQQLDQFFQALLQEMNSGQQGQATQQAQQMGEQLPQLAQQAAEAGSQSAQQFLQMMQQTQPISARLGAKLEKVMLLNQKCPRGYEFKKGGKFGTGRCMKCENDDPVSTGNSGMSVADIWKSERKKKKTSKKENGGIITREAIEKFSEMFKCGGKNKISFKKKLSLCDGGAVKDKISFKKKLSLEEGGEMEEKKKKGGKKAQTMINIKVTDNSRKFKEIKK